MFSSIYFIRETTRASSWEQWEVKKWCLVKIIVWVWTRAQASCLEELKVNINVKSVTFDVSYFFLPLQRSHSSSGIITVSSNHLLYSSTKTVDSCRADERLKMGERRKEADRERERDIFFPLLSTDTLKNKTSSHYLFQISSRLTQSIFLNRPSMNRPDSVPTLFQLNNRL